MVAFSNIDKVVDGVYVDSVNGVPGTDWPIGTPGMPVSNLTDALAIATARRTWNIYLHGLNFIIPVTFVGDNQWNFIGMGVGDNPGQSDAIDLNGQNVAGATFRYLTIYGDMVTNQITYDNAMFMDCSIQTNNIHRASIIRGSVGDAYIVGPTPLNEIRDAYFNEATLDGTNGGSGAVAQVRILRSSGSLSIQNITSAGARIEINGLGFTLTIAASCTAGTINVYGDVKIINNSGGTVVNDYTNKPKAETPVNITATNAGETDFLNLATAGFHYTIDDLILKCADPGVNTINVKLYKLVNGASTLVDTYAITTATFTTFFNMNDMFGQSTLAGDNLKITVQVTGGGPYIVLGSYAARSA